jgi:mannose-6-phosphate isomerase
MTLFVLKNPIMPYAWGSHSVIADLLGAPTPSAEPQAELWLGSHPKAPSGVTHAGATESLLSLIEGAPEDVLGKRLVERFGPRLPFLLKVLAAETPLSLQAHPNLDQARAGFEREEREGIPLDAPHRNYKDRSHKPELLCALTRFDALCGFRPIGRTLQLFEELAVPELEELATLLRAQPDANGLRELFSRLMTAAPAAARELVEATLGACRKLDGAGSGFASEAAWALRVADLYPGDPGIVSALLLNLVSLEPGQALYLPAGNLHAYLHGAGIEIMASSDNVLRGGLTPKHVDVPELLRVLDFGDRDVTPIQGHTMTHERIYETPAPEFQLSRVALGPGERLERLERAGPQILLCVEGEFDLEEHHAQSVRLARGKSVFVPANAAACTLQGSGTAYRAMVNPKAI